jgi:hypothetical protein
VPETRLPSGSVARLPLRGARRLSGNVQDAGPLALSALLDGDRDDADTALAGELPDRLLEIAAAADQLAEVARCTARGRRS